MGFDLILKKENEISETDMFDREMCISVGKSFINFNKTCEGGDSTYLKSAGMIENSE